MFNYNWSLFNTTIGCIFVVGVLVVFGWAEHDSFSMIAAGISALLVWLTINMAPQRSWSQHVIGLSIYCIADWELTFLSGLVEGTTGARLLSMLVVIIVGHLFLIKEYIRFWLPGVSCTGTCLPRYFVVRGR